MIIDVNKDNFKELYIYIYYIVLYNIIFYAFLKLIYFMLFYQSPINQIT